MILLVVFLWFLVSTMTALAVGAVIHKAGGGDIGADAPSVAGAPSPRAADLRSVHAHELEAG